MKLPRSLLGNLLKLQEVTETKQQLVQFNPPQNHKWYFLYTVYTVYVQIEQKKYKVCQTVVGSADFGNIAQLLAYVSGLYDMLSQRQLIESEMSHWSFISCSSVTWFFATAAPLQETRSSLESINSYGRNERDHRLWPILSSHRQQDPCWTHFLQDTYLLNILTLRWHFSDTQIRRKLALFDTCLSHQHILARSGNWCFPPCFTTDKNGHLNGFIGETMN